MGNYKKVAVFANEKKTTKPTVYLAIEKGDLDWTEVLGIKVLRDTQKNRDWTPNEKMKRL